MVIDADGHVIETEEIFKRDLEGEYTRASLKRWAIQKYFQVDQHIRAFGAIYANCPDRKVRVAIGQRVRH